MQYGLTRFHQYVYGQVVTVETDHKPLLGIKQKPITDVSPRLQRMRLRCQPYDYNLKSCPEALKSYWLGRNDLTEYDGIVFKGQQVVMPVALPKAAMSDIHGGHFGIGKCTERAKMVGVRPQLKIALVAMLTFC